MTDVKYGKFDISRLWQRSNHEAFLRQRRRKLRVRKYVPGASPSLGELERGETRCGLSP
jgi:hypothetical protein